MNEENEIFQGRVQVLSRLEYLFQMPRIKSKYEEHMGL